MFSQKYKEEATEDLFNSMDQLDRIEFQNKRIQQNQVINSIKISDGILVLSTFVSALFFANYCYNYSYLYSLGINSYTHISAIGNTFIVFSLLFISSIISFLVRLNKINKFKKENDEELDFILDKE